jgi:hypothetical protein
MSTLLIVQILKALVEIALMFFLARGVMVLFFIPAPHKLDGNFIYQLFVKGTSPIVALLRMVTPKFVLDRHLPWAAFGFLLIIWLGLSVTKVQLCADNPSAQGCEAITKKRGDR